MPTSKKSKSNPASLTQRLRKNDSALSLASAGLPDTPVDIDISSTYDTADDGGTSDGEKTKSPEDELRKRIIFGL